jgi:hypothetical protein
MVPRRRSSRLSFFTLQFATAKLTSVFALVARLAERLNLMRLVFLDEVMIAKAIYFINRLNDNVVNLSIVI